MTIKPIITSQKSKDECAEEQNQNLGGTVNSPNREKRKSVAFEENGPRHVRRTPQKGSNRIKRDHQKRLEAANTRTVEPHSKSNVASTASSSLGCASGANAIGSASVVQVAGQGKDQLGEETPSGYNSGDEHQGRDAGLTEIEWKQRDEEFVKLIAKDGLIVKEIEEDGACLFRSISLQIYGDQDMHEDIRQQTMDYISQNREYFAQFLTEDIAGYISRKRKKNVHGNHIEIQAMSEIYNRPVELYCYQSKPINIFNSEQRNNGYEPLRLSYQRSSHYNAILDPYKASVGVGLGLAGYQPDELDLKQVQQAVRVSEELEIEQTMFEDKLKTTDWEATNEAIEEQIARESYLQWCRENMQRTKKSVSSTVTSQSSLSMPGSSGSSNASAANASMSTMATPSSIVGGGGECNINNATAASKLISCDNNKGMSSSATATLAGRMSPKQLQQYQQSEDGLKCSSSSGSSTCCTSTASSSSSSSSSGSGSSGSLLGTAEYFEGTRQRRRRRRHNHHNVHNNSNSNINSNNVPERGSDLPKAAPPPELGGLNLAETRSTDSMDSDCSDETLSKKMKRRLEGEEDQQQETVTVTGKGVQSHENEGSGNDQQKVATITMTEEEEEDMERQGERMKSNNTDDRHSGSSVELTEPGPSTSGVEGGSAKEVPENFYHSLLESSYTDDGSLQMTEAEMIQRAIQMSRIDYLTRTQKNSDYDSP